MRGLRGGDSSCVDATRGGCPAASGVIGGAVADADFLRHEEMQNQPRRRARRASSRDVVRVEKFPGMEPPSRRRRYARPRRARRLHGENHKCHASDHEGCACEFRDRRRALQLQRRPGRQRDRSARRSDKPEDRQIFFRRSSSSSIRRPASSASRSATMHRRTISPHTRRC